ncbi:hypothetical protein ILUMI_09534, partial [Ignelater luminosus]
ILETLDSKVSDKTLHKSPNKSSTDKQVVHVATGNSRNIFSCSFCKQNTHHTYKCQRLLSLSSKEQYLELKRLSICINCLKFGHKVDKCSGKNCRVCNKRHNSILHDFNYDSKAQNPNNANNSQNSCKLLINQQESANKGTNTKGEPNSDLVTENSTEMVANWSQVTLTSHENHKTHVLLATALIHIVDQDKNLVKCWALLDSASQSNFCTRKLYQRLKLSGTKVNMPVSADPEFNVSQKVDLLPRTKIFFHLLHNQRISLDPNKPFIQNTKFGWILAGPLLLGSPQGDLKEVACFLSTSSINETIQKFWDIENVNIAQSKLSAEELECELHFRENVKQDATGKEYEDLGHMARVDPNLNKPNKIYNDLSHHAVITNLSSTTRVRVVFNALSKTTSGLSLNDVLRIGPKVQNDLVDILLRMRIHAIVIVADIEKMYRMILIVQTQRNFQRIVWRPDPNSEIRHYALNTVTYDTLKSLNIPRCILSVNSISVKLHGFCDSSQLAYGACVYVWARNDEGKVDSNLLCSKSHLAPLSCVSLPRLELCGTLLLAQLMLKVTRALRHDVSSITYWTDSSIVLAWLNAEPSKWKVFVSNRVAEIQRLTEGYCWKHVSTKDNLADIVSRGLDTHSLQGEPLWWYGPSWLRIDREHWPSY